MQISFFIYRLHLMYIWGGWVFYINVYLKTLSVKLSKDFNPFANIISIQEPNYDCRIKFIKSSHIFFFLCRDRWKSHFLSIDCNYPSAEIFLHKPWRPKGYFQLEGVINVLVSSFCLI